MSVEAVIFTAPSGAGKTTIVREMLKRIPRLAFSVSATTRPQRDYEKDGIHYHFLTVEKFKEIKNGGGFIETEEVYQGRYYGTLISEIQRLKSQGKVAVFDVDVEGALSLKEYFGDKALAVFISPPDIDVLEQRLRNRDSEDESSLLERLRKAEQELTYSGKFDYTLMNDDLDLAFNEAENLLVRHITSYDEESE